jgi:hypothetical protein
MPLSGDETGSDADRRGVQQPRSWRNAMTIRVGINGFRRIEDGSLTNLTAVLGRDVTAAEGCGGDA